ncbi:MAG: hypothetical protein IJC57_03880, partial [Clostridia bacterium]|nr:hypothetical protein [Clostridia bacterium]
YLKYLVPAGVLATIPIGLELKFLYDIFSSPSKKLETITEKDILTGFEKFIEYINLNTTYNKLEISEAENNLVNLLANFDKNTQNINNKTKEIEQKLKDSENYIKRLEVFMEYAPANITNNIRKLYDHINTTLITPKIAEIKEHVEDKIVPELQNQFTKFADNITKNIDGVIPDLGIPNEPKMPEISLEIKPPPSSTPLGLDTQGGLPGMPPPPPGLPGMANFSTVGNQVDPFRKAINDVSTDLLKKNSPGIIVSNCKKYANQLFVSDEYLNMKYILDNYPDKLKNILENVKNKYPQYDISEKTIGVFWPLFCAPGFVQSYKELQKSITELSKLREDQQYVASTKLLDFTKDLDEDVIGKQIKNFLDSVNSDISDLEKYIFTKLNTALISGLNRVYPQPRIETDDQKGTKKTIKNQKNWYDKLEYVWAKNIINNKKKVLDNNSKLERFLSNLKIKLDNKTVLSNLKSSYNKLKSRITGKDKKLCETIEKNLKKIEDKLSICEKDLFVKKIDGIERELTKNKIIQGLSKIPADLPGKLSFLIKDFGLSQQEIEKILNSEIEKFEEIIDPENYKLHYTDIKLVAGHALESVPKSK